MRRPQMVLVFIALILLISLQASSRAGAASPPTSAEASAPAQSAADLRQFLDFYASLYVGVRYEAQKAEWGASTDVTDEHVGERIAGGKALAALVGSPAVITRSREFLKHPEQVSAIDARQLQKILLEAAEAPGTVPAIVAQR